MLDDHMFLDKYYQGRLLSGLWNKFVFQLENNNIDFDSHNLRLTPTLNLYYALRTFFFGTDSHKYFLLSYFILFATILALSVFLYLVILEIAQDSKRRVRRYVFVVCAATLFTFPTVIRNYVTLGVSEQIGPLFLFISYILLFFIGLKTDKRSQFIAAFLLPVNTLILMGIKENYAIFSFIVLIISVFNWGRLLRVSRISLIFSILIDSLFLLRVKTQILDVGVDVYGKSTGLDSFIESFLELFRQKIFACLIVIVILILVIARLKSFKINLLIYTPLFLYITDWVFYRGDIRDRYATNSVISIFLLLLFLVFILSKFKLDVEIILIAICVIIVTINWNKASNAIGDQIDATKNFDSGIARIVNISQENSKIAFVAQTEWDFESADSVATQLVSRGIKGKVYLYMPFEFVEKSNLGVQMKIWSTLGLSYKFKPKPKDLNNFDICIFSQIKQKNYMEPSCKRNVVIKWLP